MTIQKNSKAIWRRKQYLYSLKGENAILAVTFQNGTFRAVYWSILFIFLPLTMIGFGQISDLIQKVYELASLTS